MYMEIIMHVFVQDFVHSSLLINLQYMYIIIQQVHFYLQLILHSI